MVTDYLAASGLDAVSRNFAISTWWATAAPRASETAGRSPEPISKAIKDNNLVAVSVLSGNRNFEGRINPLCRANYLASPPLVVAYALAGRMDFDIVNEPLGNDKSGKPVFLRDIWPTPQEVESTMRASVTSQMFRTEYSDVFTGDAHWRKLAGSGRRSLRLAGEIHLHQRPALFRADASEAGRNWTDLRGMRVLAVLGDSVTTDHISPAGSIPADSARRENI